MGPGHLYFFKTPPSPIPGDRVAVPGLGFHPTDKCLLEIVHLCSRDPKVEELITS